MNFRNIIGITAVATMVFFTGCAKVPQVTIDEAKVAIESAKNAGAEVYSAEQLKSAEVSFDLGMTDISEQGKKLPIVRKYEKSIELFQSAIAAANSAKNDVELSKQKIKGETEAMMIQIKGITDSMSILVDLAKKKKKDVSLISADLDSAKAGVVACSLSISNGDMIASKEMATGIVNKVVTLKSSLDSILSSAKK